MIEKIKARPMYASRVKHEEEEGMQAWEQGRKPIGQH